MLQGSPLIRRAKRMLREKKTFECGSVPLFASEIGTRLQRIIRRETAASVPCGKCKRMIQSLNRMTVDEVRQRMDQIVEAITENAKEKAPHLWERLAVRLDELVHFGHTRRKIRGWVEEALAQEEAALAADRESAVTPQAE